MGGPGDCLSMRQRTLSVKKDSQQKTSRKTEGKEEDREGLHLLGGDLLAVYLQHACAATAVATHVVERECAKSEVVVFEVEHEGVLARRSDTGNRKSDAAS